ALMALSLPVARAGGASTPPAEPTMGPLISGTVARLAGTHVWTDYAYDDRGTTPNAAGSYPAEAGSHAGELIQLQLPPGSDGVRVTAVLETLKDAAVPSLGVGIDTDADASTGSPGVPGGGWKVSSPLGLERFVIIEASGYRVLAWDGASWVAAGTGGA